ncbi:MAG: C39 family peptidase [Thermoleophilia bacterium]|nr:C39 family peptidase [Thermoleophilia bacterium]
MRGFPVVRPALVALLALLLALAVATPAMAADAAAADLPDSYIIEDVPLWQQVDAFSCGASAAQMVMDHWGPFIDQNEVRAAARTGRGKAPDTALGTAVPDLARAGQFSFMSESIGEAYGETIWGYSTRTLGYGAFHYGLEEGASEDEVLRWFDQVKAIVAAGYPVVCLTDWLPDMYGPHYRVVVGYNDNDGVIYFNDPWVREFRNDFGARGSFAQFKGEPSPSTYGSMEWSYEDWLDVWNLPGDDWGQPGYTYNAVIIAPWEVEIEAPETVAAGETFEVTATVTYPCFKPFATGDWPAFPASATTIALALPDGWSVQGGGAEAMVGDLLAGESAEATFMVKASGKAGEFALGVTGSGFVSGWLEERGQFPAYDYTDLVGGSGEVTIAVAAD